MKTTESHDIAQSASGPTHDEIARRAHALWLRRGSPAGSAMDDWLEAERQLRREQTAAPRGNRSGAADEIDENKLSDRLDDFGEPETRSYTSVD